MNGLSDAGVTKSTLRPKRSSRKRESPTKFFKFFLVGGELHEEIDIALRCGSVPGKGAEHTQSQYTKALNGRGARLQCHHQLCAVLYHHREVRPLLLKYRHGTDRPGVAGHGYVPIPALMGFMSARYSSASCRVPARSAAPLQTCLAIT